MTIKSLALFTQNTEALLKYYSETIGINTISDGDGFSLVLPNETYIEFKKTTDPWYYHFAFNIAENQIEQALEFVKTFASPLPDPDTGNPIIDFPAWNAHSVYFIDPAKNIVEFIARHDLNTAKSGDFNINSILEISEIGTPCPDVGKSFKKLHENFHLNRYSGNFETFCATGDEHGLFILTQTERNWFPTGLKSIKAPYKIELETISGNHALEYYQGELRSIVP